MYVTSAWSLVYALDAVTGAERWVYDPKVDRAVGAKACCDVVNRGVALHDGKVFVGVIDGRLVALDAKTGCGRLGDGHRRPVAALHHHRRAASGQRPGLHRQRRRGVRRARLRLRLRRPTPASSRWRFYTVPGDPSKGPDNAASDPVMARAAATWNGQWWALGGGGTVWDAIVYDPDFNQLIVGVGNGSPWNQQIRSPGGGDNLFLVVDRRARCRHRRVQVALPDHTGRDLGLHRDAADRARRAHDRRQAAEGRDAGAEERLLLRRGPRERPADFRAAISADVAGEGHTGWTAYQLGVRRRLEDGPPGREPGGSLPRRQPRWSGPGPSGAHNWHPMAFSPQTGLVYLPAQDMALGYAHDAESGHAARGSRISASPSTRSPTMPPCGPPSRAPRRACCSRGTRSRSARSGGRTDAGRGMAGHWPPPAALCSRARATDSSWRSTPGPGKTLWSTDNQAATLAGPISYEIGGEQYVAVRPATAAPSS